MAMQTDVKATKPRAVTGAFVDQGNNNVGRSRVKGIFITCGASAGEVTIADGSGGTTLISLNTPVDTVQGTVYILIPGEGILAENGLYGTLANVTSTVLFYG